MPTRKPRRLTLVCVQSDRDEFTPLHTYDALLRNRGLMAVVMVGLTRYNFGRRSWYEDFWYGRSRFIAAPTHSSRRKAP
jgi:hypothetical protein